MAVTPLINIHMDEFLHSSWTREMQFSGNSGEKRKSSAKIKDFKLQSPHALAQFCASLKKNTRWLIYSKSCDYLHKPNARVFQNLQ